MTISPETSSNPYQRDAVRYVERITALFGGYKARSFAFLDLQSGHSVLEAGCGAGDDAVALASMVGSSGRVVGVDNSTSMLNAARKKAAEAGAAVEFVSGDITALPLNDESFDRVRVDRVLQHVVDPAKAVAELIRVARSEAVISLLDVDWTSLRVDAGNPHATRAVMACQQRQSANPLVGVQLYALMKSSGLDDVEVYAETVCVTELPVAIMIWQLDGLAEQAAAEGDLGREEAMAWLADLRERDKENRFFGSITGYVARGRKA